MSGGRTLLRRAIAVTGLSDRQFATDMIGRNERTVRRWLDLGVTPPGVVPVLRRIIAGEVDAPAPRRRGRPRKRRRSSSSKVVA